MKSVPLWIDFLRACVICGCFLSCAMAGAVRLSHTAEAKSIKTNPVSSVFLETAMTQALREHRMVQALLLSRRLLRCSAGKMPADEQHRLLWVRHKRTALLAQWLSLKNTANKHHSLSLEYRQLLAPHAAYEAPQDELDWHHLITVVDQDLLACDLNGDRFCDLNDLKHAFLWENRCLDTEGGSPLSIKRLDFDHDDCVTREDLYTLLWTAGDWDVAHEPVDAFCEKDTAPLIPLYEKQPQ